MAQEPKKKWEVGPPQPHSIVSSCGIAFDPSVCEITWPPGWSWPQPVLSNGEVPKAYALLAGWVGENVWGWHALVGLFPTREDALTKAAECQKGEWWQVVHLFTGEIVAEGTQ
jgi:hypothetical protein